MSFIKHLREQAGFTQAELASRTGLSLRTIQRLESTNKEPKGHTLQVLSDEFQLTTVEFQNKFKNIEESKNSDKTAIRFINLSVLTFLGIPFGNIIFPLILWYKKRNSQFVDEMGRRIVNFQIIFSAILSILLSISPFVDRWLFGNSQLVLIILFVAYAINVLVVCTTALKVQRDNFNFLNLPIRFV